MLFDRLTKGMFNFCENKSLITSSLTNALKSTVLPVLGLSLVNMESKSNLNVDSIDIYPNLLQNLENLLKKN